MQLLDNLPTDEPRVIHVIHRELGQVVANGLPERYSFSGAVDGSPGYERLAPEAGPSTHLQGARFNTQGDTFTRGFGESFQEDLLLGDSLPAPPAPSMNHFGFDPFDLDLGAHGYSPSFQSTFSLVGTGMREGLNIGGQRDTAHSEVEGTLLSEEAYPDYVLETLSYTLDLPPAGNNYYSLWRYILEYWFPSTSGFEVVQDWDPESAFRYHVAVQLDPSLRKPHPSFAVFDMTSPSQPFLFLHIHDAHGQLAQARITAEEGFEVLHTCSFMAEFKSLCVISAIGAKWGMFVREPGWRDGDTGYDYIGEWEEDVTSNESFKVMGYCFEEMKKDVMGRRRRG